MAVGAVAVRAGRLVLVRRANAPGVGLWSIPGGRVEWGETLAAAVERELTEETGLTGRCGVEIGWVQRIADDTHFVIVDFAVHVDDPSTLRAGSDALEAAWVPLADVLTLPLVEGLGAFLTDHHVLPEGHETPDLRG